MRIYIDLIERKVTAKRLRFEQKSRYKRYFNGVMKETSNIYWLKMSRLLCPLRRFYSLQVRYFCFF